MAKKTEDQPQTGGISVPPEAVITMKPAGAHNQIKLPRMALKTPLQRPTRQTTKAP